MRRRRLSAPGSPGTAAGPPALSRSALGAHARDQLLGLRQHVLHDHVDPVGIRMFAVDLNKPGIVRHAVQHEYGYQTYEWVAASAG